MRDFVVSKENEQKKGEAEREGKQMFVEAVSVAREKDGTEKHQGGNGDKEVVHELFHGIIITWKIRQWRC